MWEGFDKLFTNMRWHPATAIAIGGLFLLIIFLAILEGYWPTRERKGFLPMATTRGDRVFISITATILCVFLWLMFIPAASGLWPVCVAAAFSGLTMRWG